VVEEQGELVGDSNSKAASKSGSLTADGVPGVKAETPQSKTRPPNSSAYSSFPSSFVRTLHCPLLLNIHKLNPCFSRTAELANIRAITPIEYKTNSSWVRLRVVNAYEDETGRTGEIGEGDFRAGGGGLIWTVW